MRCSLIEALFDAREEPYGNCKSWRCFIMTGSLCRKLTIRLGGFPNSIRRIIFPVKMYIYSALRNIALFSVYGKMMFFYWDRGQKITTKCKLLQVFPLYNNVYRAVSCSEKGREKQ